MPEQQGLLVVDDDINLTQVMDRAFSRRHYTVYTANNTQEALRLCQIYLPERCLLDLKIATESGLALIPQLLQIQPDLQIVMLTGYSSISTAVDAIKLGAVNYLCKPADADDILAAFENTEGDITSEIQPTPPSVSRLEWEHIQRVLSENDGNISATARALGMHRRTLQRKLQKRPVKQ